MRIAFGVLFLLIAYVASYPSYGGVATDDDENDGNFELKLRSILNHLSNERNSNEHMTRSFGTEDDDEQDNDEDDYMFSKRQGGHNIVDKQSKCEIECIYSQRNPSRGKGKSVKEAAKVCRQMCPNTSKRRGGDKSNTKTSKSKNLSLRELLADDASENQRAQRREFYDSLMEQILRNNDE